MVVVVVVELNNRNVVAVMVVYSLTIHEAVLKNVECRVGVGSMWGRFRVDVGSIGGRCICGWKNI